MVRRKTKINKSKLVQTLLIEARKEESKALRVYLRAKKKVDALSKRLDKLESRIGILEVEHPLQACTDRLEKKNRK